MMLTGDYEPCHMARNTQVMFVANNEQKLRLPAKNLDLNAIDHMFY